MLWILDPGHGENTPGKSSGEFEEWRFNRDVLKYITYELTAAKIDYYITVCEDYDIRLRERQERADAAADKYKADHNENSILISIHGNAYYGQNPEKVDGIETWYYSLRGKALAAVFQQELVKKIGWRDRGIKKGNFWIIKKTSMPAVLLELGFYSNPHQRELMMQAEYQYKMGMAIKNIILNINNRK